MEIESSTIQILAFITAVAILFWKVYSKLDDKIGGLSNEMRSLTKEFIDFRAEIRTRFAMQDQEEVKKMIQPVVDSTVKNLLGKPQ